MSKADRFRPQGLIKIVVIALAAFGGGIGGIYLGSVMFKTNAESAQLRQETGTSFYENQGEYLNLKIGDLFPLEEVRDATGNSKNMEEILNARPTIVLFVSLDCEPCNDLLDMWQQIIRKKLRPAVQVLVVVKDSKSPIPDEYKGLFSGMKRISIDLEHWEAMYSIGEWPTVISVDGSGFVSQIQVGFLGYFRPGLFDDYVETPS